VSEYGGLGIRGQFLGTLRGLFDYSGRSTRTELAIYYLGCLFVTILASAILYFVLEFEAKRLVNKGIEVALIVPAIALFVRRMHDQNRSGWWVLLPVLLYSYNTALGLAAELQGTAARVSFERAMRQFDLIPFFASLAVLALTFYPGTPGPNRFGPDPRCQSD